ncbi:OLC1v1014878C1 [Oldenlandia corymbosa var. corymbosa]|uniref:MMS19 nucleotide excision repair protein n=1 Tax=Oldenlandia corymbosa var. corymbosa TaxID=529605 RepID=A0AAV1E2Q9_OLDCO|nr:OLC1v1014878C1 [Oldenlandia corymbosa var. corymbosa]
MAVPAEYVKHIELYVDSSSSPSQQIACVDSLAILLKTGVLTLEALVKEMDLYLTTTDSIIRSRGILLLGEIVSRLKLIPLRDAAIHSLIRFFIERLEDWRALRGALVGCLALMTRKRDVGVVKDDDAKALAKSFTEFLQVPSLAQHDRKLCYELLECLLDRYPNVVRVMGDELLYAICEAIDEEKDPQCLILTFHIVEVAAQLFPDSSGPFAKYAAEFFEILGSYFPIHFTHPKDEDVGVGRDELSRALMLAFGSTPLFEPYSIPLLIDKLSSTLPSSKVDSLKFLVYCSSRYGSDRMVKHGEELWSSLKDVLYTSPQSALSAVSKSFVGMVFEESDVMIQALALLQELMQNNGDLFLNLILSDEDINVFMKSLTLPCDDITLQIKQRLHSVGRVLSISAESSIASCNRVFDKFFPSLLEALGFSVGSHSKENCITETGNVSFTSNYRALYVCVELLDACRHLMLDLKDFTSHSDIALETCCCMLQNYSSSLAVVFFSSLEAVAARNDQDPFAHSGAKGLQVLATFPGSICLILSLPFENILLNLVSAITSDFNKIFLWNLNLKSLVVIGLFIYQYQESEKALSFERLVVEKVVYLVFADEPAMPLPLKFEAILEIGRTSKSNLLRVIQGMDKAISANFAQAYVKGSLESVELMIKLLECYSTKVLPWFEDNGGSEEVALNFTASFWELIENCSLSGLTLQNKELLKATVMMLKEAVRCCSCQGQEKVVRRAFKVLSGSTSTLNASPPGTSLSKSEGLCLSHYSDSDLFKDDWVLVLFTSVVIALRPQTCIPNVNMIVQMLLTSFGRGHICSAQALGSLVNKSPSKSNASNVPKGCGTEEIIDTIFSSSIWTTCKSDRGSKCLEPANGSETYFSNSLNDLDCAPLHICAIVGFAWIGKGLVMRGHEKVKDIAMAFLGYLDQNINAVDFSQFHGHSEICKEQEWSTARFASDTFHILMSDSGPCLNRRYHAVIRPLYKQRFFSTMMPILSSLMMESDTLSSRSMLSRSFAHLVSEAPLSAIIGEAKKIIPLLVNSLSMLTGDILNKDVVYSMLLVLSGILIEKNGQEAVEENAHVIINQLIQLAVFPHMMVIRGTAIQCISAMSRLPHARIYPLRTKVLQALSKSLDDPKRAVRQEAVRCRQAWTSFCRVPCCPYLLNKPEPTDLCISNGKSMSRLQNISCFPALGAEAVSL